MSKPDSVVFVIDDDASVRDAIQSLIRSVGLHVESYASAQEFLRNKRPDLPGCIVLDVRLPGFSGLELQRKLADADILIPNCFHDRSRRHPYVSEGNEGRRRGVPDQAI